MMENCGHWLTDCCVQLDRVNQVLELIRQSQIHQETWQKVRLLAVYQFISFYYYCLYLCIARIILNPRLQPVLSPVAEVDMKPSRSR